MSTAPDATSAALPDDDPPDERDGSQGFRTGPGREVKLDPEKHRSSQTALPAMVAPAARRRLTTVASRVGTNPSTVSEPFIIGTPATMVLSLIATVRPAIGPFPPSVISVRTYHAPRRLSCSSGRYHLRSSRCGGAVRA
jgi:hypothetical protein